MNNQPPITIDGSAGEGGGQVLRTSLALSLVTGRPFRLVNVRGGRKKPGLMRQHLAAVRAAAEVGRAAVEGAELRSGEVAFRPSTAPAAGDYTFAVGTAGSATLVFQTVLPALLAAGGTSRLVLRGGTHNPMAPTFEFLDRAFLPVVRALGFRAAAELVRPGYFPAGGGEFQAVVEASDAAAAPRVDLVARGELRHRRATATVSQLPGYIAERELAAVQRALDLEEGELDPRVVDGAACAGNDVRVELAYEHVTEVFTAIGAQGVSAERVGREAAKQAQRYLKSDAPVGEHLADQLILPFALAGGGSFRTLSLSRHFTTNLETVRRFLEIDVRTEREDRLAWRVTLGRPTDEGSV